MTAPSGDVPATLAYPEVAAALPETAGFAR